MSNNKEEVTKEKIISIKKKVKKLGGTQKEYKEIMEAGLRAFIKALRQMPNISSKRRIKWL